MLYLCHRGGRGHTVSATPGGLTSCLICFSDVIVTLLSQKFVETIGEVLELLTFTRWRHFTLHS